MSQITTQTDPSNLTNLSDVTRFLSIFQKSAIEAVNGNIEFQNNVKCDIVTATLKNGTQVQIAHNLGRAPKGYILVGSNVSVNVYNTKLSDSSFIYPIGNAVANVTLLVF